MVRYDGGDTMDFPYDQSLEGEKPHRFKWFMYYHDIEPPRSLEKLHRSCTKAAPKKGVSLRNLKQYSVNFHWQQRCEALMEKRQNEIDGFIDPDFLIATRMQGVVDKKLEVLEKVEDMDVKELRTPLATIMNWLL